MCVPGGALSARSPGHSLQYVVFVGARPVWFSRLVLGSLVLFDKLRRAGKRNVYNLDV